MWRTVILTTAVTCTVTAATIGTLKIYDPDLRPRWTLAPLIIGVSYVLTSEITKWF